MNVVVFSGTTEGRELSRQLAALGIEVTVSVATPLGQEEQGSTPGVTVRCGRLLPDEMAALLGDAAGSGGERKQSAQRETHPRGQRIGPRMEVGQPPGDRLQKRRG